MTIKKFVEDALRAGKTPDQIWRSAEAKFPWRAVSWSYILRIIRMTNGAKG